MTLMQNQNASDICNLGQEVFNLVRLIVDICTLIPVIKRLISDKKGKAKRAKPKHLKGKAVKAKPKHLKVKVRKTNKKNKN